jgi:hypothetical protein
MHGLMSLVIRRAVWGARPRSLALFALVCVREADPCSAGVKCVGPGTKTADVRQLTVRISSEGGLGPNTTTCAGATMSP